MFKNGNFDAFFSALIMFSQLQTIMSIVMNFFKQKTSLSYYLSSLRMGVICERGLCAAVYGNRVSTATYI